MKKRRWKIGLNDWIGFLSILSGGGDEEGEERIKTASAFLLVLDTCSLVEVKGVQVQDR